MQSLYKQCIKLPRAIAAHYTGVYEKRYVPPGLHQYTTKLDTTNSSLECPQNSQQLWWLFAITAHHTTLRNGSNEVHVLLDDPERQGLSLQGSTETRTVQKIISVLVSIRHSTPSQAVGKCSELQKQKEPGSFPLQLLPGKIAFR